MRLIKRDGIFIAVSDYYEKDIPKRAGFSWDHNKKRWWTNDPGKAAKLVAFAEPEIRPELETILTLREQSREMSRAASLDMSIPAPSGLDYLPYQKAGIAYAMQRPSTLIADEMGLGKTIQAIGIINVSDARRILVVCPASLRLNWQREIEKWLTRKLTVAIADTKSAGAIHSYNIIIVNYDILSRMPLLGMVDWDLMIADECHYAKNGKAQRSKALYSIKANRRVFLTGTPIVNRPKEIFPIIHALDPVSFPSFWKFAHQFCEAHHNGFGWDFDGAVNLDELQDLLRSTVMVRRLKNDVLKELPPKRRQIIEFESKEALAAINNERLVMAAREEELIKLRAAVELAKAGESLEEYDRAVNALRAGRLAAFEEMARLRHDTAVAKIPFVAAHVHSIIDEDPDYKIVIMCHHKDVVRALAEDFGPKAVILVGDSSMEQRQMAVDRFQNDKGIQVFIGSIRAAGVGITLTASAHVVFAELDWTPANMAQAEDRVHRIGQEESVLIQMLVLAGSIDAGMAQTLARKLNVISKALDDEYNEIESDVWTEEEAGAAIGEATERREAAQAEWRDNKREKEERKSVTREWIEQRAATITGDEIGNVHRKLQWLAAACDGAFRQDGAGFNKIDAPIGRELAKLDRLTPKQAALGERLIHKYRRQLGE